MSQNKNFFRFYLTEADPWYTGDFDATFDDVISGCRGLLEYIKEVYNLQLQQLKENNSSGYGAEHSCDN